MAAWLCEKEKSRIVLRSSQIMIENSLLAGHFHQIVLR